MKDKIWPCLLTMCVVLVAGNFLVRLWFCGFEISEAWLVETLWGHHAKVVYAVLLIANLLAWYDHVATKR